MVLTNWGGKADSVVTTAFSMVSARRSGIFAEMFRLRMDLPSLYFPSVSLFPWRFPLRRSTFRFPFTRYFS